MPNPEFLVPPTFDADDQELEVLDRSERLVPPTFDIALSHEEHRAMALQQVDHRQRSDDISLANAPLVVRDFVRTSWSNVRSAVKAKSHLSQAQEELSTVDADPEKKNVIQYHIKKADNCLDVIGRNTFRLIDCVANGFKGECASNAPPGLLADPAFMHAITVRSSLAIEEDQEPTGSSSSIPPPFSPPSPRRVESDDPPSVTLKINPRNFPRDQATQNPSKMRRRAAKREMKDVETIADRSGMYAASLPADHPEKKKAEELAAKAKEKTSWLASLYSILRACGKATKSGASKVWYFFF